MNVALFRGTAHEIPSKEIRGQCSYRSNGNGRPISQVLWQGPLSIDPVPFPLVLLLNPHEGE